MPESKTSAFSKFHFLINLIRLLKTPQAWLAIFASLFLAVLFYFHDVRIENVKVGTISSRFVVAQTDFDHIDKVGTKLLKNQAKYQVGSVFKFDERALLLQLNNLKKDFPELHENFIKELDQFIEVLIHSRFSDQKTLKKMQELKWTGKEQFFIYSHQAGGLPEHFWHYLLPRGASPYLVKLVSKLESIPFILIADIELEAKLQKLAYDSVDPIKAHFKAGHLLLGPGDKIQDYHKDLMVSMKNAQKQNKVLFSSFQVFASIVLGSLFTFLYGFYLRKGHPDIVYSFSKLLLLTLLMIMGIGGAKCLEILILKSGLPYLDGLRYTPILSLAVLMISLLIDRQVALLSLLLMLVMTYLFLAFEPGKFILVNLISSASILLTTVKINRRRQIFTSILQSYGLLLPGLIAFHIYDKNLLNISFLYDLLGNFGFMIVACLLILLALPFIERFFRVTTDMVLTEFLDPSNELLRRLTLEAPGTYQHSLLVGHLAEYGARAIGANDLFCRVAALYHDIGKIYNPQYFTENQLGGFNIHRLLSPKESAQVIIAHVDEGEKLARKYGLPESFIDIMKEHHGTTLVYYFYKKELEKVGEEKGCVLEHDFRYKGPKPRSKESAILMIADCVEAASRSLESATEEEITKLVEKIVKERHFDGQLDDSSLTFEELKKVKKAIVKGLMVTHHVRVRYPVHEMTLEPSI
jgi:cyclic-di-AMP phosphodiesterase PgpH